MTDNLKGIMWMVLAMAAFAVADATIKTLTQSMPPGQLLAFVGAGGATVFSLWVWASREQVAWRLLKHPMSLLRTAGELVGTMAVIMALALAPLSVVSTILQANPLLVTLGAALFLGARVGPHRWVAIFLGLLGVILVIQPWSASFAPASLLAVICAIGLAVRDLATRVVPDGLSTKVLAAAALAAEVPAGLFLLMMPFSGPPIWPDPTQWILVGITVIIICVAYFAITAAMRVGEVAVVTPFRYSRILFALTIAVVFFGETLNAVMLIGAALTIASGLYTLWRERIAISR